MGHPLGMVIESSAQAVASLSNVVATATAVGDWEVAKAGNELQRVVINVVVQNKDPSGTQATAFDKRLTELEKSVERAGVPRTKTFKCIQDYKACMEDAKNAGERWICRVGLGVCMGEPYIKIVGGS